MAMEILTRDDLDKFKQQFFEEFFEEFRTCLKENEENKTTPANDVVQKENPKKWLKTVDVLKMLKIAPSTLLLKRVNGEIPYTRIGNTLFYDNDDIQTILQQNKSFKISNPNT
jgi:hypothetical protein